MNVPTTIDAAAWLGKYLEGANGDTDLAQAMLAAFAEALMSAESSMQCGAGTGAPHSPSSSAQPPATAPWGGM